MSKLYEKRVLLGVTGGIASYKAAEVVRLLTSEGASVRVAMTQSATAFVAPLTFQALSGHSVHLELLDAEVESAMGHISLARWAELILISPATANFIAKMRIGLADDLLSTICLAADVPIVIAPAMNRVMWTNAATQENIRLLKERGIHCIGPEEGSQACGESGYGRMMEADKICRQLQSLFSEKILHGIPVLVTAGPTQEAIDPVRYISNRSSGKMGFAIAQAATDAGAEVTLVAGPTAMENPHVRSIIKVRSATEMNTACIGFKVFSFRSKSYCKRPIWHR